MARTLRRRPGLVPDGGIRVPERIAQRAAIDEALAPWLSPRTAHHAMPELLRAGIAAAALATSRDLVDSDHLREHGFWDTHGTGVLPGLPWRASFGRSAGVAPELGADTDAVLGDVLGFSPAEIAALRKSGAFG